jgi:hypothetical protein
MHTVFRPGPTRSNLYGRDIQEGREAHVLQGGIGRGSEGTFYSSLEGNTRRAVDFGEADEIDESALKALLRSAADLNAR